MSAMGAASASLRFKGAGQELFHGSQEVDGVVGRRDHGLLLHVSARYKSGGPVRINGPAPSCASSSMTKIRVSLAYMLPAIFAQQAHRIVVIGLLSLRGIHQVNRRTEVPGVIVH